MPNCYIIVLGGSLTFSTQGRWGKEKNLTAAKNPVRSSEGAAEGGCGGNSAAPERRNPAAPPEYLKGGTEQKNILFLFRRKNQARANQEKRRIFFCEVAAGALAEAGGGAGQSVFRSKKVRAKDIISPLCLNIKIMSGERRHTLPVS